ncbi:hypothetical protein [Shewanella khirikhana]|uniref:Toxin co-regulated pilus biosynthesis protein Q C-terminal domain-containing protein n=1 Tax=Shewanella khirikhana TaxID=1965282 RepID=A0ABM8HK31_9GAMM|nr:hypothetical protein [Shewanella khirikhana]AZQ13329.1 hypothetical protein STH12_04303 [Shewanella khirikhana]
MSKKLVLLLMAVHTASFAMQPKIENESATYSQDGIVISADVVRSSPQATPAPRNESPTIAHPTAQTVQSTPEATPAPVITHNLFIYPDESFYDAINRWLRADGYTTVAWSIDAEASEALAKHPQSVVSFAGSVRTALPTLSKQIGVPLYFSGSSSLAAIHQWHNRQVQIVLVNGLSLRDAVQKLAQDYGWNWNESNQSPSWLATNDYPFLTSYPIVTPQGDLARALGLVLDGFPVSAQLLDSTQTLFIVDTK